MKINYIESVDGTKLFSFTRHDYKEYTDKIAVLENCKSISN